jgi:hypothetical protein
MKLTETKSGLLIPKVKEEPKPVVKSFPVMEVQDEKERLQVEKALNELWNTLGLKDNGGGIKLPGYDYSRIEFHKNMMHFFGKTLLGADYKGFEEYT